MNAEEHETCNVSDVVLRESNEDIVQDDIKSRKRPKRILHFSDGDLVEYSEDEDERNGRPEVKTVAQVDPKTLNWLPWTWYQTTSFGSKVLDGCDYLGEWLASFFGITSPKYQFEINEFYRQQALENEMARKQDLEMGGWNDQNKNNIIGGNRVLSNSHT